MIVLARGGWALCAALFLLVASSVLHADHVGLVPAILLAAAVAICAWRPMSGLEIVMGAIPVSGYLMTYAGRNGNVSWAEVLACAAIAGLAIDAARRPAAARVAFLVRAPALIFTLVLLSSIAASLAVRSLTVGPAFAGDLGRHLAKYYFIEGAAYPGLHTGMLLLEGVLLFTLAARIAGEKRPALERVVAALVTGATLAGVMNIARLLQAALRNDAVLSSILRLSHTVRWNLEYPDYNAAGSFFAMALFAAAALIVASPRRRRWWTINAIVIATALWLTGSRAAYVAGVLALAVAYVARWTKGTARKRWVTGAALAGAIVVLVGIIAFASPRRGNQGSSLAAADIRLQMAMVGARMIATHPAYGIGLGEFYQRTGEFITWNLYFAFPVSLHENAHNNFVQVAAELGLLGGIPFVWLVGAGLLVASRGARGRDQAGDPSPLLLFAGIAAFVITWLAGHPLLIPEPAYAFWIVFGAAVGATDVGRPSAGRISSRRIVAVLAVAIVIASPLHARAVMDDAELEHIGFGLSPVWLMSPDGIRYRAAQGHGAVFVPSQSPFTFSVNPRVDHPVRLEIRIDGRVADVVTLAPRQWNDVTFPRRSDHPSSRFVQMDLRALDRGQIEIWLTKVRPLGGR